MNISSYFTQNSTTPGNIPTDVYNKVSNIMQGQSSAAPKLNAALSADKTTLSGLGQLRSALTTFQGVAQALRDKNLNLSATSSAPGVLTATTSSRSAAGAYDIQVTQLAQSQVLTSKPQASAETAIGNGTATTLSFDFGKASGSAFTTSTSAKTRTVDIPAGSNSLQGIAAAINGANIGVTAKVTSSGAGYVLELQSPSGAANSMRIGVSGDAALQGLLAFNPVGEQNLTQTVAAQNAALTVNGVAVESAANTVADALPGTTLSLAAKGGSRLTVTQGSAQFVQNVTNLVSSFNALNAKLSALKQGDLKGDGAATRVQNQLTQTIAAPLTLAKMGITVQKNGDLAIDSAKLQAAIASAPLGVAKAFSDSGSGIADKLVSQIQGLVGAAGSLPKKTAAINQEITALNTKKNSLEKALTAQANALVKYFSQQSTQGSFADTTSTSTSNQTNQGRSLFDFLT
ncbi:MAG: flagellar filament capping protein FliD [Sulfuricella sp.]|nr:flagellar filament capping protein FliD [Sulfuricella sp.]